MPPQSEIKLAPTRQEDEKIALSRWSAGMNSMLHPADLAQGQYYHGENIINRGGILQTRPGNRYIRAMEGVRVQGMVTYKPKRGAATMLIAIDGEIWVATAPFKNFSKLPGLAFSRTAPIINFCVCIRGAKRNADDSVALIDPTTTVIIQDGQSKAGVYDGADARHLNPELPFNETPTGLWMAWSGARLWVANGARLYASDIADPTSFKETDYLAQRSSFELPDDCTGMINTATSSGLLVFTDKTTTLFKSFVLQRTDWRTTPEFQKVIIDSIGCVAGRSPVNQYGVTHWFCRSGLINLDMALNSQQSSEVITIDGQMQRSKSRLAPDLSGITTVAFANMLLCSVPSGSRYNTHTWVLDQTPVEQGEEGQRKLAPRAWASIWTGLRPVAYSTVAINGRERCFFVTFDRLAKDGSQIHLWEAFHISKKDNGNRITCQFETAMIHLPEKHRFRYAEFDLCEILGPVEFRVFVGSEAGPWHQIKDTEIQANSGCFGSPSMRTININTIIRNHKPQTRTLRTEELRAVYDECQAESGDQPGEGRYFQLLVEWRGRCGVKEIRAVFSPRTESKVGECGGGEAGETNIVTERGVTIKVQS
jgi:hypothetical protein